MSSRNRTELSTLVERCRQGNKEAWNELIERVSPVIFAVCRMMNLSLEESFDVFGQVSYLLLTNLDKLSSPTKLLSYISTTTRREIYAMFRRSKIFSYGNQLDHLATAANSPTTPEQIYERSKRSELLMKAISQLPQRDYDLIRALFLNIQELSYSEISKKLGIPVSSIGPTRARSLAKLRTILKKKGFNL